MRRILRLGKDISMHAYKLRILLPDAPNAYRLITVPTSLSLQNLGDTCLLLLDMSEDTFAFIHIGGQHVIPMEQNAYLSEEPMEEEDEDETSPSEDITLEDYLHVSPTRTINFSYDDPIWIEKHLRQLKKKTRPKATRKVRDAESLWDASPAWQELMEEEPSPVSMFPALTIQIEEELGDYPYPYPTLHEAYGGPGYSMTTKKGRAEWIEERNKELASGFYSTKAFSYVHVVDDRQFPFFPNATKAELQELAKARGFRIPASLRKDAFRARLYDSLLAPEVVRRVLIFVDPAALFRITMSLGIEPTPFLKKWGDFPAVSTPGGFVLLTNAGYFFKPIFSSDCEMGHYFASLLKELLTPSYLAGVYPKQSWFFAAFHFCLLYYGAFTRETLQRVLRINEALQPEEEELSELLEKITSPFYIHELRTMDGTDFFCLPDLPDEVLQISADLPADKHWLPSEEEVWHPGILSQGFYPALERLLLQITGPSAKKAIPDLIAFIKDSHYNILTLQQAINALAGFLGSFPPQITQEYGEDFKRVTLENLRLPEYGGFTKNETIKNAPAPKLSVLRGGKTRKRKR